ncbi:lytic transglycosylase domain-containing protein [Profundibacterium mesophilum]|uniref:Lytic transglycosylase catalytic n=1 Tax=Profundibacterium mesophilum KAUST100406-0324 TaxID=1037889 RepID=A0A921NQ27_9RHOB|nr:lytic transglycosylase domain-containing protein [Profundibacterium mesophilum]KAF0675200.1 Lytic transglycosylase catalytic [Profundibacterium mesophilum KAUST100406-0324]
MRMIQAALAPVLLLALGMAGTATRAETAAGQSRLAIFQSQTGVLDGRAAQQYLASARLIAPGAAKAAEPAAPEPERKAAAPGYKGKYRGPYLKLARAAARRNGVPEELFLRLVQQESGWNARARSRAGAIGLAQLMPGTARELRVDPTLPGQNLEGGAIYLKQQYDRFKDWRLALAAYNAGPGAVQRYGGIPPYSETRNYVLKIWGS